MTESNFLHAEASAYETAVRESRRNPAMIQVILDNFLEEDVRSAAKRYKSSEEFRQVRALLGPPEKGNQLLLDCGGGRGLTASALSETGFQVTLCDSNIGSASGLSSARTLQTDRPFDMAQTDWEALPFPADSFDIVFCRAALHHSENIAKTLAELARVLRPGGKLLTLNDHSIARGADLPAFLASHPFTSFGVAENAHTLADYRRAFNKAGLKIQQVTDLVSAEQLLASYTSPETFRRQCMAALLLIPPLRGAWIRLTRFKNIRWCYPGKPISFLAVK